MSEHLSVQDWERATTRSTGLSVGKEETDLTGTALVLPINTHKDAY